MTPSPEPDALPANASPLNRLLAARALSDLRQGTVGSHLLGRLLSELRAPDMLQGGAKVFHTAYRVLQRSLPLVPEEERPLISSYIDELAWLHRNMVKLSGEIFTKPEDRERFFVRGNGTKLEDRKKDRHIVRSAGVEKHPLWCLLWEHHPVRKRMRGFRSLQARALLAHLAIVRYWSSQVQSIASKKNKKRQQPPLTVFCASGPGRSVILSWRTISKRKPSKVCSRAFADSKLGRTSSLTSNPSATRWDRASRATLSFRQCSETSF